MPTAARLLAYSHDGYGLGHLRRNLRLAAGLHRLRPDIEVVLATGAKDAGRLAAGFPVTCVQLPPVVKVGPGRYVPQDPALRTNDVIGLRSRILVDTIEQTQPDLLLVDRHPRGLLGELDAALEVFRSVTPDAPAVLGLRDILDAPNSVAHEWQASGLDAAITDVYQTVLCYGDRSVYDIAKEYGFTDELSRRIRYTGYLTDELLAADPVGVRRRHGMEGRPLAVCTLGGGKDAAGIAEVFLDAMLHLRASGWAGVLITGPYMAADDVGRLSRHEAIGEVQLVTVAQDVPSYLAAADAVFCMGGYNTTCEVLSLAVPAIIVPRVQPRVEQLMRAQRLARRGLVHWLHPDALTARVVAGALDYVAATPRAELFRHLESIAHRGVNLAAATLSELLPAAGWYAADLGRTSWTASG